MLTFAGIAHDDAQALLHRYGLSLIAVAADASIPGSFWGEPEAGVIGEKVYARADTPVHSLLHEACHLIVAPTHRRNRIHTDASDSQAEEDATCYLQILLADALPGVGRVRLMADMDAWGYTFRLGSAQAWFEARCRRRACVAGGAGFVACERRVVTTRLHCVLMRTSLRASSILGTLPCNAG